MRNPSLYRVCGNALAASAVLFVLGVFLATPYALQTAGEVKAAFTPLATVGWALDALAVVLAFTGVLGLVRHFSGGPGEGWATMGLAVFALGAVSLFLVFTWNALGERMVALMAASPDAPTAALDGAQMATFVMRRPLMIAGACTVWLSLLPLGIAMRGDAAFPRFASGATIAVGVIELAAILLLRYQVIVFAAITILGWIFLALLGVTSARLGRKAPAAVAPSEPVAH